MKHCIALMLAICLSFGLRAEAQERYALYPTQNMWTFLKLDTITGQMRHVQYGMEQQERFEYALNEIDIATLKDKKHVKGRYKLYATQNRWTFILPDTLDGDTFQVRWGDQCGVVPIPHGVAKRSEDKDEEKARDEGDASGSDTDKEDSVFGFLNRSGKPMNGMVVPRVGGA